MAPGQEGGGDEEEAGSGAKKKKKKLKGKKKKKKKEVTDRNCTLKACLVVAISLLTEPSFHFKKKK